MHPLLHLGVLHEEDDGPLDEGCGGVCAGEEEVPERASEVVHAQAGGEDAAGVALALLLHLEVTVHEGSLRTWRIQNTS